MPAFGTQRHCWRLPHLSAYPLLRSTPWLQLSTCPPHAPPSPHLPAHPWPRALPITARTLETIVRLSTAHAKLRWSWSVEPQDVAVARKMMEYVLRRDVAAEPEEDG